MQVKIPAKMVATLFDLGVAHGLSGRPLKRFVKRKLDKIIKKTIKGLNN